MRRITRWQVAELLGFEEHFLIELEEHEIVVPDREGRYDRIAIQRARVCFTLHHDLGVNMPGLEVALHLLELRQSERRKIYETLARLRDELDRDG